MVTNTAHRDPFRAYFTADEALGDYMVSLLHLKPNDILLEPSAGDGHLIESVKKTRVKCHITAYELNPKQVFNLNDKFHSDSSVTIIERDTILCPDLDMREGFGPRFTKILANPPYGGWQEYERRAALKKRFNGFYVRETYTLFLLRCLRLLERNGRLVFIIPNTFLYLNMHAPLRKYILESFSIETIDVFKSALFPGVSFGYADLCIISITASTPSSGHKFRLRQVNKLVQFSSEPHLASESKLIVQGDILKNSESVIPVSTEGHPVLEVAGRMTLLGEVAECKTGFYSGDDRRFLRRASDLVARSKDYKTVDLERILCDSKAFSPSLDGLEGARTFIPILKGGGHHFFKPTMWYIDWSRDAVNHYKSDKKARFQNSSFYFRRGIGFPMVTSTKPTASLIENSLFDQSVVGIFPKGINFEFLLAYCNSAPFWTSLRAINPSANNSANYIMKTPIIRPDLELEISIGRKTSELINLIKYGDAGADKLEKEILCSIECYVNKMRQTG